MHRKSIFLMFVLFLPYQIYCFESNNKQNTYSSIIHEYVARETRGEFLKQSSWLNKTVLNSERIPGYDSAILISGYRIELFDSTKNEIVYKVVYNKIADLLQDVNGSCIELNQEEVICYFNFKNIKDKWLITSFIPKSHLYPKFIESILSEKELKKLEHN